MKQGTLITKIVMLVLFLAVAAYLVFSALAGLNQPYAAALVYPYTADDQVEVTGYVVRQETLIPGQGGLVDVLLAEGEAVAKGETVAKVYADAAAMEREQQLESLRQEIQQLLYVSGRGDLSAGTVELDAGIIEQITSLKAAVARGDLDSVAEDASELKSLVFRRDYTYNGDASLSELLSQRQQEYKSLQAQTAQTTGRVYAPAAGVFSSQTDGYESVLTPGMLDDLTPSGVDALASAAQPAAEGSSLGKVADSSRWYFVANAPEEEAARLRDTVTLRFSTGFDQDIEMTVERVSRPENGRVTVVLSSNRYLSQTILLRRQTADLIYSSGSGLRVPRSALYLETREITDEETGETRQVNVTGVYCVVGLRAEWKEVNVLWEEEDFYLVEPVLSDDPVKAAAEQPYALQSGDQVITQGVGLYDGKVVG